MGRVISLVSLKGGVGKTTLSAALAVELANRFDKKVLLIDANYSAPNLGLHMDIISPGKTVHDVLSRAGIRVSAAVHEKYNVDVIPGNFMFNKEYSPLKLKQKIAQIRRGYDFIIIDSSPSLNEELTSAMLASDSLFIVSTPDYPTLSCSMKTARIIRQSGRDISGIIVNRVLGRSSQVSLEEVQESINIPVVAMIKDDRRVAKSLYQRVPMPIYAKRSQFSREIGKLAASLVGLKEKRKLWFWNKDMRKEEVNREILRESFYRSIFKD